MKKINVKPERITFRENKAFKTYLNEINNYHPLTPDKETELANKIILGDLEAKELMIKHNLRFVISVAKQYYGNNVSLEDLVNEGNVGLMMAIDNYDPSRGFKFISYAVWWIRRNILAFISNADEVVRIPNHKLTIISKIKKRYTSIEQKLLKQPSVFDLVIDLKGEFNEEDIMLFYAKYLSGNVLLDNTLGNDTGTTYKDNLVSNNGFNADHITNDETTVSEVNNILKLLKNDTQRKVIVKFFGLDGKDNETLDSISGELGVCKERVRQIKESAIKRLKTSENLNKIIKICN